MVKNFITLFLSLLLIIVFATNKVSALKERTHDRYYYESENRVLNDIGIDKLRTNFIEKFDILDNVSAKNKILIMENKDLNKQIKMKLEENKHTLSSDIWKEIRGYKNKINDKKIKAYEEVKELISAQKKIVEECNYSDKSLDDFITILINAQKIKRESIEFEKDHLFKINELIV